MTKSIQSLNDVIFKNYLKEVRYLKEAVSLNLQCLKSAFELLYTLNS